MVKNELPEGDYDEVVAKLKRTLANSRLNCNNVRHVELLLRDAGADYFKILANDSIEIKLYAQYELIWRYHGLGEDFIVYLDFD